MEHPPRPEEPPASRPNAPPAAVEPDVVGFDRLKQYSFLSACSEIVLKKLQPHVSEQRYAPDEVILRSGEYSDAAYYLSSGIVSVRLTPLEQGKRQAVPDRGSLADNKSFADRIRDVLTRRPEQQAVQRGGLTADQTIVLTDLPVDLRPNQEVLLEAGEVFGEMSALSRYAISADVVARSEVVCLLIRTSGLRLMFKQKEFTQFKKSIDDRYRARTLASHLRSVGLFTSLDDRAIAELRNRAELLSFEPGKLIVEEGAATDGLYLVRGGYVKVALRAGQADAAVTYLRKGDYAGEIGLLLDEPWPFSLFALEHVEVVKLRREDFQAALKHHPEMERQLWESVVGRLKERGSIRRDPLASRYLQMAMDTGLIHGESVLLIDLKTCTRCDDCVRACADTHGGTPRFIREGNKFRSWSVPTACYQCTDPVCMIGCPTGAITRPLGTLEVTINKDTCIGCGTCAGKKPNKQYPGCPWFNIVEVPFQSPTLNREIKLATKCDLCLGRPAGPACVQMCPHGSAVRISFKDLVTVGATLSD
jgi:CRP-like cAMP-binding protein/Fe-S-cluster-containing hydrogenase component 2